MCNKFNQQARNLAAGQCQGLDKALSEQGVWDKEGSSPPRRLVVQVQLSAGQAGDRLLLRGRQAEGEGAGPAVQG